MNKPILRFKEFSEEWESVKLSSFANRITRKNTHLQSTLALTISSAYGLVSQKDYFNNLVVGSNLSNYYLLKNGEFAYNKSYSNGFPFGSVKRLDRYEQGILSTLYIIFSINDSISSDYLTRFFDTTLWYKDVSERAAEGARNHGLLNIGAGDFLDINIGKPKSKNEQQSIASFFMSLDEQIKAAGERIASLKRVKAASLQSMFPQEGETTPRLRFKGFTGEWEKVIIGSLGEWSKGRLLSKSDIIDDGKNLCIHYGELFTIYEEVINKVVSATNQKTGCLSKNGDILFPDSDVTPTGLARCSAIMLDNVILGGGINVLRIGKENYAPFVSYSINQEKKQIISRVTGTTVRHINSSALSEVLINLPTNKAEQQKIADYFTNLDRQIALQEQRLEKLKQIKAACLDKMFV